MLEWISAPAALISLFRSLVWISPSPEFCFFFLFFFFFPFIFFRRSQRCSTSLCPSFRPPRPSVRPLPSLTMCSSQKSPLFCAAHHLEHPHETKAGRMKCLAAKKGAIYHFVQEKEEKKKRGNEQIELKSKNKHLVEIDAGRMRLFLSRQESRCFQTCRFFSSVDLEDSEPIGDSFIFPVCPRSKSFSIIFFF